MSDYVFVECEECRESISARWDGEQATLTETQVGDHLTGCAECRQWESAASRLNRSLRFQPALAVPDLTDTILAAADRVDAAPSVHTPRFSWWQRGLAAIGFVQLVLGMAQLIGVDHAGHADGSGHLFNESAAWNTGIAVGFLVTAFFPAFARGLLPALGVFVVVLVLVSVADLIGGHVHGDRLATHVMVVLGCILLLMVERQHRRSPVPFRERPGRFTRFGSDSDSESSPAPSGFQSRPGRLRPAGQHRHAA